MQITVAELGKLLDGEIVGNPDTIISKVAKIEEGEPEALSFLSNQKYEPYLYVTKSSAVLVNRDFVPASPVETVMIKVNDAYSAFTFLLEKFGSAAMNRTGIDSRAAVATSVRTGKDVFIGALTCVEDHVEIGD